MTSGTTTSDPAQLRAALADYIRGRTTFRTSSGKFAAQASCLLHRWDRERPGQPTITARPAGSTHAQTPSVAHIDRPHTQLAITW